MIHRIIYQGVNLKENRETIKKVQVPVHPSTVLQMKGPFLEVEITPPSIIRSELEKQGKQIPSIKASALIDTGASISVIHPDIASKLNLPHTGYQNITSVQDKQEQPVYFGSVVFSWNRAKETSLIACPLTNVDCLIGRDILRHWYLTYDGPNGTIVICD